MICQNCTKNKATVHVTEITEVTVDGDQTDSGSGSDAESESGSEDPGPEPDTGLNKNVQRRIKEQHLCDTCAENMNLPHMPVLKKSMADIWKLLKYSAQQTRKRSSLTCPDCGMTLDELRKKGRLGCAKDYEVFRAHIDELLERVHGAKHHVGRLPGISEDELDRMQHVTDLQHKLEIAIREEAYESAAKIRDELKNLEDSGTELADYTGPAEPAGPPAQTEP